MSAFYDHKDPSGNLAGTLKFFEDRDKEPK